MWWIAILGCVQPPTEAESDTPAFERIPFCLNEFMPSNGGSLAIDGGTPDWLELHNPTADDLILDGFSLSDDDEEPHKFPLDGLMLLAGEYRVLLADGDELPFNLMAAGEVLLLTSVDGRTSRIEYGAAAVDVAWARESDCCEGECWASTVFGTPGVSNGGSQ